MLAHEPAPVVIDEFEIKHGTSHPLRRERRAAFEIERRIMR
ncbi:hypothetical protein RLEG3_14015 [Rhizobium leguminosarum bv. trifolii WSM1689]|nr:hypothetical protein RLEG3_14015 [Rhizobium leguminosarum bv. trifolii WSM1689]